MKSFQERLAEAISLARKPKSALAKHLGVPQSSVSRWLAGSEPRAETVSEIAKFLNVDVKWLAYGDEPAPTDTWQTDDSGTALVREDPTPYGGAATKVLETMQAKDATMQIMLRAIAEMQRRIDELEEIVRSRQPPRE